jgi:hypothetical protein
MAWNKSWDVLAGYNIWLYIPVPILFPISDLLSSMFSCYTHTFKIYWVHTHSNVQHLYILGVFWVLPLFLEFLWVANYFQNNFVKKGLMQQICTCYTAVMQSYNILPPPPTPPPPNAPVFGRWCQKGVGQREGERLENRPCRIFTSGVGVHMRNRTPDV